MPNKNMSKRGTDIHDVSTRDIDGNSSDEETDTNSSLVNNGTTHEPLIEDDGEGTHEDKFDEKRNGNAEEVIVEDIEKRPLVSDGGWGWVIVLGCILLRVIIGGIIRSNPLFYVRFLERFNGTAAQTAWVTALGATVRLLVGPIVSMLCNRISCRTLVAIGAILYVVALHVSAYATSLTYLYMTYGILGGLGRSFLMTPCTILLSQYFNKKASLAFGLASTGFGIGGFVVTPLIAMVFQHYGFTGTFILLSGFACHLFICVTIFKSPAREEKAASNTEDGINALIVENTLSDENDFLTSHISSTGSVHLVHSRTPEVEVEPLSKENYGKPGRRSSLKKAVVWFKNRSAKETPSREKEKKKWISFSILKDIRFLTLCFASFLFSVPSSGVFLAALANDRGLTDFESAYLLSITAGCDTFIRAAAGFVLDLKHMRRFRPIIYNVTSFLQGFSFFLLPMAQTFWQFAFICGFRGIIMGLKASQRNVVLLDILGVKNLSSSFAYLLTVQGIGTLVGPPLSGYLKDHYGKYDYAFYFGGVAVILGSFVLAYGNLRNHLQNRSKANKNDKDVQV